MFKRISVEEWQAVLTVVSFAIFGVVFLAMLARAIWLPKQQVQKLSELPLQDDTQP